ncbi:MAG: DUF4129 domain-containing protein [Chloroflexi bacterium]|nr:DUF4129 domain-containing protein [Chloroflexota bacterium]
MFERRILLAGALLFVLAAIAAGAVWTGIDRVATGFQPLPADGRLSPLESVTNPQFRLPPVAFLSYSFGALLLAGAVAFLYVSHFRPSPRTIVLLASLFAIALVLIALGLSAGRNTLAELAGTGSRGAATGTALSWLLVLVPVLAGVAALAGLLLKGPLSPARLLAASGLFSLLLVGVLCTPLTAGGGLGGGGQGAGGMGGGPGQLLENGLNVDMNGLAPAILGAAPMISPQGAHQLPDMPVFQVAGAQNVPLLRTTIGNFYNGFAWRQDPPAAFQPYQGQALADPQMGAPMLKASPHVSPIPGRSLPAGPLPISASPTSVQSPAPLEFDPSTRQFQSKKPIDSEYSWETEFPAYSENMLQSATATPTEQEVQLPANISDRVTKLSRQITSPYDTPYEKAKAIEVYLKKTYPYDFNYPDAPPGREPTDWFLFDGKSGVCANFASAFTVLARASGLPTRMAAGWAVSPTAGDQVVHADQAHAWPEVRFDDQGWTPFEPTPGGPPTRSSRPETPDVAPPAPRTPTVTVITDAGASARKGRTYTIHGVVRVQTTGAPVDGLPVQVFLNQQKTLVGAIPIGEGTALNGVFTIEAEIPKEVEVGQRYQLIAVTSGNDQYEGSESDPTVTVFTASTLTLESPAQANVDEPVLFKGDLLEEFGQPIPNQRVTLSASAIGVIGSAATTYEGSYAIPHVFKDVGDYQIQVIFGATPLYLSANASKPLRVMMPTTLRLEGPSQQEVRQPAAFRLRLTDARGAPLRNQPVTITIDDQRILLTTGPEGGASLARSFDRQGTYRISADFEGAGFLSPSHFTIPLRAYTVSIDITTSEEWVRGKETEVAGSLRLKGDPLLQERVVIKLDGEPLADVVTDAKGEFSFRQALPKDIPLGHHVLGYGIPRFEEERPQEISFKAATRLETPGELRGTRGDVASFTASLYDDQDAPVSGAELEASGPQDVAASATTTGQGAADVVIPLDEDLPAGPYQVSVRFAGSPLYLPAETAAPLEVLSPAAWWPYAVAGGAALAAGCAIIVWLWLRRRSNAVLTMEPAGAAEGSLEEHRKQAIMRVTFPDIVSPFPPVWGVGEALTVEAAVSEAESGAPLQGSSLTVGGHESQPFQTDAAGLARFRVRYNAKGQQTVAASFPGDPMHLPASGAQSIRIVDYREEIVALFKTILQWARAAGVNAPEDSTPREIEANVAAKLPTVDSEALGAVVRSFEEADYSLHPMTRKQYERMYLACNSLTTLPVAEPR